MMDVAIPFLLILMMWDPAAEQDSMTVTTRLMASQEECETAGRAIAADRAEVPDSRWARSKAFAWRCEEAEFTLSVRRAPTIP